MQNQDSSRENLGSRLGFILLTAGCAIGLGNIWRFPFICGQYGGAIFVLIYLFFLIALGFPVMVMELSLGRASRRNIFGAYKTLAQDKRLKWHYPGAVFFLGNVVLMIFYTTVTGWMVAYALKFATGAVSGLGAEGVGRHFGDFLANPVAMVGCMLFAVVFATAICAIGLRKGVERITKLLMGCLFLLLVGLCIRALFLPGAAEGMRFYLWPNPASIEHAEEPYVKVNIIAPNEYVGNIMPMCQDRRGEFKDMQYLDTHLVELHYQMPLNEIIYDFFDALKANTRGYASLDYELSGYRTSELVKVDMKLNGDGVDALSFIAHKDKAYPRARRLCEKLKENIPRQLFEIPVQAAIGGRVIARETVKAMRKDVLAKCYGGDITRKKKLLEKQKEGKKKMRQLGSVEVPQEAFMAVLKLDE